MLKLVLVVVLGAIFINLMKLHPAAIQFHLDDGYGVTFYNLWKFNFINAKSLILTKPRIVTVIRYLSNVMDR